MNTSARFVAEISSNHNGDLNRCLAFIDEAARIGCDAVKFQYFRIRELFAPEILQKSEKHRKREKWELPKAFLSAIAARCRKKGIEFGCTPFFLEGVTDLVPYVGFFKIASYELLWDALLTACAETAIPVVLSTGMASMDEVSHAVDVLAASGCRQLTILHCVSGYPTPVRECNLATIETLRKKYLRIKPEVQIDVGWSDHSVMPGVIYRAVHRWESSMIEFHMDLDGKGDEFVSGHCWLPDEMHDVIKTIKKGFQADGMGDKTPMPCEQMERLWRADPEDGLRPLLKTRTSWNLNFTGNS